MKKHINTLMAFCMACCVLCNAVLAHPLNAVENHDSTHEAYVEASRAIIGIEWNEEDNRLFFAEKPDYEEIKAAFPKALDVFLGDGSKASIPVSWETQDDYLESDAAEYVFYPYSSGYEFTTSIPHILVEIGSGNVELLGAASRQIGDSEIRQRIDTLYGILGGKFFNKRDVSGGLDCGTKASSHGGGNLTCCRLSYVIKEPWFTSTFGYLGISQMPSHNGATQSNYPDGWSCYGFANFATWYIFNDSANSSVSTYKVGTYSNPT